MPPAPSGARISYEPSFVPDARFTSTPQFRVPVQHDRRRGHRLATERGDDEKAPPIGGREEAVSGGSRVEAALEKRVRGAGLHAASGLNVDRHQLLGGSGPFERRSASVCPSRCSMTRYSVPSCVPTS